MRISRPKKIIIAVTAIAALSGGSALAYWTSNGGSTSAGTATAGSSSGVTVAQITLPTDVSPGVAAQFISFSVKNDSTTSNAYVNRVVATFRSVDAITGAAGACSTADFDLVNPSADNVTTDILPGATKTVSAADGGISIQFHNLPTTAQDGCKNAVVHLTLTAS